MPNTSPPIATIQELSSIYSSDRTGVFLVKPKVVFKKIEDMFGAPVSIDLQVPSSNIGSLTMLEATIMTSLLKILNPSCVFEFGTFLGYSTSLLLRNTKNTCKVYSLDLDMQASDLEHAKDYSDQVLRSDHIRNDDYLRYVQAEKGPYYLSNVDPSILKRLKLLKGNSLNFDCASGSLCGEVDFVFVDGGHEYDIIKSDSKKSYDMIGNDGIILWHDYNSKIHFDVTKYLQDSSGDGIIIHIENTMLAFCLRGEAKDKFLD